MFNSRQGEMKWNSTAFWDNHIGTECLLLLTGILFIYVGCVRRHCIQDDHRAVFLLRFLRYSGISLDPRGKKGSLMLYI